jgi:endonuclease III
VPGEKRKSCSSSERIKRVARILTARYGDFAHHNKANPLDELLFILCSVKTAASSYHSTYLALKREFPRFDQIAEAPAPYIARPIEHGGLSNNKAKAIRAIMDRLVEEFGRPTLSPLRDWPDEECEAFLTSLPYAGKKVARCVMMYALGRKVFPVDTHCWRIAVRLGWVRPKRVRRRDPGTEMLRRNPGVTGGEMPSRVSSLIPHLSSALSPPPSSLRSPRASGLEPPTPKDMDRLQANIPPELRFSLHVNFVSLGREFCTALNPRCPECPIAKHCKKIGVEKQST